MHLHMQRPTNKQSGNVALQSLLIVLIFMAAIGAILYNRQSINDYWQLHDYRAPNEVLQIVNQDTFTDYSRKVLYVNHPEIATKSDFGHFCPDGAREQTIVLGCYHSNQAGIYVLNVIDPRLNGVKQVTAAHEMLHAAYDRLSSKERASVDSQLVAYYKNDLKDPRLLSTLDAYKKSEPTDVVNEMHSIFGTEVANLPAGLEQYYKKYFVDRSKVVGFSTQYQTEFTSRQAKVAAADVQLSALKVQIDAARTDLDTKQAEISTSQASLLALRNSGDVNGYNAGVAGYNALVSAYNAEVQLLKDAVARYNQLVASRNAIALEEDQLVKSLNAEVAPIKN